MSPEDDHELGAVLRFTADYLKRPLQELGPTTRLAEDLSLLGDDAGEFLDAYSHQFNVIFSDFDFRRYFPEEGAWGPFMYLLRQKIGRQDTTFETVTLQDLADAVKRGKW